MFGISGMFYFGLSGRKKSRLLMILLLYWSAVALMHLLADKFEFVRQFLPVSYLQSSIIILLPLFVLGVIGVFYIRVHSSIQLNFVNYASTAEPMVQASQPSQTFSHFISKIDEISSQYDNQYPEVKWKVSLDTRFNAPLIIVPDSNEGKVLEERVKNGQRNRTEADFIEQNLGSDYVRLNYTRMSWYWFRSSDISSEFILFRKIDRQPDNERRFSLFYKPFK
ncbi:MAG: hypothetical protein OIN87_11420 [Candidatus Methanoperedens sp.]|nr:hypothetical protein [Candidatus Methanoperedens sp.]